MVYAAHYHNVVHIHDIQVAREYDNFEIHTLLIHAMLYCLCLYSVVANCVLVSPLIYGCQSRCTSEVVYMSALGHARVVPGKQEE